VPGTGVHGSESVFIMADRRSMMTGFGVHPQPEVSGDCIEDASEPNLDNAAVQPM
jgi:hypothetical protein